jgi:hypothetical protein
MLSARDRPPSTGRGPPFSQSCTLLTRRWYGSEKQWNCVTQATVALISHRDLLPSLSPLPPSLHPFLPPSLRTALCLLSGPSLILHALVGLTMHAPILSNSIQVRQLDSAGCTPLHRLCQHPHRITMDALRALIDFDSSALHTEAAPPTLPPQLQLQQRERQQQQQQLMLQNWGRRGGSASGGGGGGTLTLLAVARSGSSLDDLNDEHDDPVITDAGMLPLHFLAREGAPQALLDAVSAATYPPGSVPDLLECAKSGLWHLVRQRLLDIAESQQQQRKRVGGKGGGAGFAAAAARGGADGGGGVLQTREVRPSAWVARSIVVIVVVHCAATLWHPRTGAIGCSRL